MFSSLCKTALQNNQRKKQKQRPQMSNFTKWHLTHEIVRILTAFSRFLWNLTFIFSGSHNKFSLVLLQITISTSTALKNVKKKIAIFFKLFWYKVFVHWKLKLLSFLVDSVFKRRPRNDRNAMEVGGRAGQAKRKGNSRVRWQQRNLSKSVIRAALGSRGFFFLISN